MKIITKKSKNTFKNKDGKQVNYINHYLVADNGKLVQFKCAYSDDWARIGMLADSDINVIVVKKQSKDTYKNKDGKECHYYNYFVRSDNNKSIQIRCSYGADYSKLDMVSIYEK